MVFLYQQCHTGNISLSRLVTFAEPPFTPYPRLTWNTPSDRKPAVRLGQSLSPACFLTQIFITLYSKYNCPKHRMLYKCVLSCNTFLETVGNRNLRDWYLKLAAKNTFKELQSSHVIKYFLICIIVKTWLLQIPHCESWRILAMQEAYPERNAINNHLPQPFVVKRHWSMNNN